MLGYTPGQVHPPGQVYPSRYTPPSRYKPRQVHTPQQVQPPGRYTLPGRYTPLALAGTPPGQVHPPGRYTPLGRYTPVRYTLPGRCTPLAGTPPGRYTPLAGTPPQQVHLPGRYTHPPTHTHTTVTAEDGTHPTEMLSFCIVKFVYCDWIYSSSRTGEFSGSSVLHPKKEIKFVNCDNCPLLVGKYLNSFSCSSKKFSNKHN